MAGLLQRFSSAVAARCAATPGAIAAAFSPAFFALLAAPLAAPLVVLLLLSPGHTAAQALSLDLGTVEGEGWRAGAVKIALNLSGPARIDVQDLRVADKPLGRITIHCGALLMQGGVTRCQKGRAVLPGATSANAADAGAKGAAPLALELAWTPKERRLQLELRGPDDELWRLDSRGGAQSFELSRARLPRLSALAPWLPPGLAFSAGQASGTVKSQPLAIEIQLATESLAFADESGLKAAEQLKGALNLKAQRAKVADAWQWEGALKLDEGALLVNSFYLEKLGHALTARGSLDAASLDVTAVNLKWAGLGEVNGALQVDRAKQEVRAFTLDGKNLALSGLKPLIPQTVIEQGALADLSLDGRLDLALDWRGEALAQGRMKITDASLAAPTQKLSLSGLNFDAELQPQRKTDVRLALNRMQVRDLTLGPIESAGHLERGVLTVENFVVPVLGGALALADIEVKRDEQGVDARWQGAFTPIPMRELTTALGWLPMAGTISGVLPRMSYRKSTLAVDGALLFKVFDGDATVDEIRLENPFGKTPRLTADVRLKNLDLEAMTGAVKFGTITGKLDVNVDELVMENWQPLSFDAVLKTSSGDFRKRISQRAVQNISSIGGAGAGAAIQRSFLSFFETFGYSRLGFSCRLRNGVCEMGGIERGAEGYMLIEGGGVPALNVRGYNRMVGWQELIDRIKAVIEGNSQLIIR